MKISFHGHTCFTLEHQGVTIATDPPMPETGLKLGELKADIVTVCQDAPAYRNALAVKGDPKIISWPGEYETKGVHVRAIYTFSTKGSEPTENLISVFHFKDMRVCHLGAQAEKLAEEQVDQLGEVDILFVPVGGNGLLNAKAAKEVVEQLEPRIVIPMAYQTEGSKLGMEALGPFLSEMGAAGTEPLPQLNLKRSDLPEDTTKLMILT